MNTAGNNAIDTQEYRPLSLAVNPQDRFSQDDTSQGFRAPPEALDFRQVADLVIAVIDHGPGVGVPDLRYFTKPFSLHSVNGYPQDMQENGDSDALFLPCSVWRVMIMAVGEGESDVGGARDDDDLCHAFERRSAGVLYGPKRRFPHLTRVHIVVVGRWKRFPRPKENRRFRAKILFP
jgi:hypothetical protein